jgi:hypothetical protein
MILAAGGKGHLEVSFREHKILLLQIFVLLIFEVNSYADLFSLNQRGPFILTEILTNENYVT